MPSKSMRTEVGAPSLSEISKEDVQCMLAILIHTNLMKGYFAHKSEVLVLSKQDPFPKPSGKPVNQ
ncbi:Enhanced ethylene response protein 5 [Asimina triloba]